MMKAAVVDAPGGPEVLRVRHIPRPTPQPGWVIIRVKAFGLNRSEMFTRQGHSTSVRFPRVLGIVEEAPDMPLQPGQTVATLMGEMGRPFDGGYAEYTCVPLACVIPFESQLDWPILGAVPEMYQTVWHSLTEAHEVRAGQTILIRGGTSSIGMAATVLAKELGLTVIATTRQSAKVPALLANGADHVILDTGQMAGRGAAAVPQRRGACAGVDWHGDIARLASMRRAQRRGVHERSFGQRMDADRVFHLDDIVEAHRYMESNQATGKLVALTASKP